MNSKSGLADSPFFSRPVTQPSPKSEADARPPVRTPDRVTSRTPERPTARPGERKVIRHSFNIYQDQYEALKRMVARKALQGEQTTLADLLRDAIDTFLNKHV